MNLFLLTLSLLGTAIGSAIVQPGDLPAQKKQYTGAQAPANVQRVPYPLEAQNNAAPSQYYYPTYPEYTEPGYAVQSGYEGYLVPSTPAVPSSGWASGVLSALGPAMRFAMTYGTRAGGYILNLLLLLLVGGAFTTSICTFTPFCTITFLGLGLTRNQVREQVTELARTYITPERVSAATTLVKGAIDKYAAMQKEDHDDTDDEKILEEKPKEDKQ